MSLNQTLIVVDTKIFSICIVIILIVLNAFNHFKYYVFVTMEFLIQMFNFV